ncbi:response regulator transcription factor [Corynebacterium sp. ES2794-CONJ1]|uniref:response regulator transcription factor n=1 Tax=unclassified Corynebacterium TaxID=2624378 RepID=UPI002167ABBD|nr:MULTISPECIES: response regulator transcription factor [unclassified Corynebacterium]MCS4489729.1 response regulator transcription factor [Corynebacterium sp. ES2775-CONJ]MCS4491262.1 response regulator transcription factor [Corynebacterium sp. ES2715-CONJ3]MCS4531641.1 response regulator transcription factor [Corynebacterium sp. ES2730-CONJ]MCU9519037.1 response regulator transcription factor [Corynebacterium sp. ES2794-CONJ1]
MTTVLLVEDEMALASPLIFLLEKEGYQVIHAANGPSALVECDTQAIDIVLLDLMLPGMSGVAVCKELREMSSVPVIMVTAKDSEEDKIRGFEVGADDYVTKPFSAKELVARIKAVLRRGPDRSVDRSIDRSEDRGDQVERGTSRLILDTDTRSIVVDGLRQSLAPKECELLEYFMCNPGNVLTRGLLIERVWGADYAGATKTLDVHIKRLRSKIEKDPSNPIHLMTVRGVGYRFEP